MSENYEPPVIDWGASPAEMAEAIYRRSNPFDNVWLQRLIDQLYRERRDLRVTNRVSAEESTALSQQCNFLTDTRSELYVLQQFDQAQAQERRKHEQAELRQIEERTLAKKRAIEADEGAFNSYYKRQVAAAVAEAKENAVSVGLTVARRALGLAVMYKIFYDRLSVRVTALEDALKGRGQT